jgi:hypothetical protein
MFTTDSMFQVLVSCVKITAFRTNFQTIDWVLTNWTLALCLQGNLPLLLKLISDVHNYQRPKRRTHRHDDDLHCLVGHGLLVLVDATDRILATSGIPRN